MEIPKILNEVSSCPITFPNCCLSISTILIDTLASVLPKHPAFTISIGSGSGLLEALISYYRPDVSIKGVEVTSTINRYIAEQDMYTVGGTWDLLPSTSVAEAWMFVYPRESKLITKYMDAYGDGNVKLILWLGPRADWVDYEPIFRESVFSDIIIPENAGLARFEILAIMKKKQDLSRIG